MIPNEEAAAKWIESGRWPDEDRSCAKRRSCHIHENPKWMPMSYRCPDCKKLFSVRNGSVLKREGDSREKRLGRV